MDELELYNALKGFFPRHPKLMIYLSPGACWQYEIHERTLDDPQPKLVFWLEKKTDEEIMMHDVEPGIKPDLILYFTEKAILKLTSKDPTAVEYFKEYKELMNNSSEEVDLDNKLNKSKIQLFKLGYKKWQSTYNF